MAEDSLENIERAQDLASDAGDWIAEKTGIPGAGLAVEGAAAVGAVIGEGIRQTFNTDEHLSNGLLDLVGDEHSYAASQAWDEGDYLGVASEMLQGAGETIGAWAGETFGDAADAVGDAAGWFGDAAGDAAGWFGDTAGDAWDAAGDAVDSVGDALGDAADAVGDFFDDIF